jgi:hypothetical protein
MRPHNCCHVRPPIGSVKAAVDGEPAADRDVEPLRELRAADDQQNRSPDQPGAASALDAYDCRLDDRSVGPHPRSGDRMGIRPNLQIRRNHRPMRREHRDRSMTDPIQIHHAGASRHRSNQYDRQQES